MTIRPLIAIFMAAFNGPRKEAGERLVEQLRPQCAALGVPLYVHHDYGAKGSLGPWLHVLNHAVDEYDDITHVTVLSDDSIVVPHFVEVLLKVIAAQPEAILCMQSNHVQSPEAYAAGARWYTTDDGFTAFGGTMPIAWVVEHLQWRREALRPDVLVQGDEGVNTWAMMTGRRIFKTLPSLVDHDLSFPSLDGNDHHVNQSPRRPLVWEPETDLRDVEWKGPKAYLGRTYLANQWETVWRLRPECWDLDRTYDIDRGGPIDDKPHVFIGTPAYGGPQLAYLRSVARTSEDLHANGIGCFHLMTDGDSLVTRGRQHLVHDFLRSRATHLLQWDSDIECLDPSAVRKMLATGYDVIGGAYPKRDGSGEVVCSIHGQGEQRLHLTDGGTCTKVSEIGTGFLMTSRKVIVDLMKRHPELLYESEYSSYLNAPIWALFDSALEKMPNGRQRFASEDWHFCTLARAAGYDVHVYIPPVFRHWGDHGNEGHIVTAWKMAAGS